MCVCLRIPLISFSFGDPVVLNGCVFDEFISVLWHNIDRLDEFGKEHCWNQGFGVIMCSSCEFYCE